MTETDFNTMPVACDDCDWTGTGADIETTLHMIHHLADRLDPGGIVPAGECPECGALAYKAEPEPLPTEVTVRLQWYVLINPSWYDDSADRGYAWSGEADHEVGAVAQAIAACDADNDREAPSTRDDVAVWDAHPDVAKNIVAVAKAYDQLLNEHEIAPAGHDYNELCSLITYAAAAETSLVVRLDTSRSAR